jgi:hypothetical protein
MAGADIIGTRKPAPPILAGRPTWKWDAPDLTGQIVAELLAPQTNREAGRQGIPLANVLRQLPATAPLRRFSAVRGSQLRSFRLDCNAGLTNSEIQIAGNVVHYRRSESGPAGVLLRFDDAGNEAHWLPAGGYIAGAVFDRLYVTSAAAVAGFATLTVADDPRQGALIFGNAPV